MSELNVFLARQPIFDRRLAVVGYQLLARSGPQNIFAETDVDGASRRVVRDTLLVYQLDSAAGTRRAFVNVTRRLLTQDFLFALPRERVVLRVHETVEPDVEVLEALRALKVAGYRIALDDPVPRPEQKPLIGLADIVKVNFLDVLGDERRKRHERYAAAGRTLLADRVETPDDARQALEAGYSLLQGYFFCEPEMLARKDVPRCKVNYLRFLRELFRAELDIDRLEEVIKEDPSLTIKLLRYLNSVGIGARTRIESVRHALIYLGEVPLKRWASLIAICEIGQGKPSELAVTGLTRARFCELIRSVGETDDGTGAFLSGLLSTLDVMIGRPMDELLAEVGVSPEIEAAIRGDDTPMGRALELVKALERGHWERAAEAAEALGVSERAYAGCYREAVRWVDHIFSEAYAEAA